jgi:aryl-alcohol dehydrogenase-like predicted oxidoreductase
MNYRPLGDRGVKLSEIGLGGWLTFGNAVDQDVGRKVLDAAFDCGINFFDNANAYATGKCEEAWGELLRDRRRSDYVLATKVFFPMGDGPNDRGLSRKHVTEQCHASLRRLRTDYIDLYQCHRWDEDTPLAETVSTMNDLVRSGKVLYWGFSMWTPAQIEACLKLCDAHNWERPRSSQPPYNCLDRQNEAEVFPLCHRQGIGQVVYSPLAQGILTGKYKPGQPLPEGSRATDDRQNKFIKNRLADEDLLQKAQQFTKIAEEHDLTPAQLALAWCLRRPEVTSLITGATRPEQVHANAEASGITLDDDAVRAVNELFPA